MNRDLRFGRAGTPVSSFDPERMDAPTSAEEAQPLFPSMFLGGFECSAKRRADGRRLDLLATTGHDRFAEADYRLLRRHGVSAARDGLRWHLIEATPNQYDWSSALPMVRAAQRVGVQIIWDLCHYGWPDGIDIWSDAFVDRFSRFAAAAARLVTAESDATPFFCTVNEISFWAWAGGETGQFAPATHGRGNELKRQLARASIAATAAIRAVAPHARFIHAEPAIHIDPGAAKPEEIAFCEHYRRAQFEALDMIAGRFEPELGGAPEFLDVVGINYYPDNQWYLHGGTIPLGHHAYRPLRDLLAEYHARYGRPMILAETGAEGSARASWLHYVGAEVRAAQRAGTPVEGICLYPILDYQGWHNDRTCPVGLFSLPDADGRRVTDPDFSEELDRQRFLFAGAARSRGAAG